MLYREVQRQLTESLAAGEWKPGSMLPTEPQLAKRYGVGISTVRAAVRELELSSVLTRTQGKGTFVSFFNERKSSHRFLNVVLSDGTRQASTRRLLSLERMEAHDDIADMLGLPHTLRGRQVFKLCTVLSLGDVPVYYSNVFLPVALFPRLRKSQFPDGNDSLYSLYQLHFNINVTKVVDALSAVPATPMIAKLTGLDTDGWALHLRRVAYDYKDTRVEVRLNWINSTRHNYRIQQGGMEG